MKTSSCESARTIFIHMLYWLKTSLKFTALVWTLVNFFDAIQLINYFVHSFHRIISICCRLKKHFLGPELFLKFNFFLHEQLINLRFSEHCGKWHLKQMLAQFIVMSVVVRLLFTLLYQSSSSSPSFFVIFLVHIYFIKKRILDLNKFIKNTTQVLLLY